MKACAAILLCCSRICLSLSRAASTASARWEHAACITVLARDPAPTSQLFSARNFSILAGDATVRIARFSHETRLLAFVPTGWPYRPVLQHLTYLHTATAVPPDAPVVLRIHSARRTLRLPPLSQSAVQCLQVNSLGYLPDDHTKLARMGGWTGTGGPLSFGPHTTQFFVVDAATRSNVFAGIPVLLHPRDPASGARVYALDFSPLTTPGRYYLHVPGVGSSLPFTIARDVYQPVATALLRALYHQRCGTPLEPAYTSHTRPRPCHRLRTPPPGLFLHLRPVAALQPNPPAEPGDGVDDEAQSPPRDQFVLSNP